MKSEDLRTAAATQIIAAVSQGQISAEEVCRFFLNRIDQFNPRLNAFVSVNELALEQARQIDNRRKAGQSLGRLAGLPIAVKDVICVAQMPATAGSKMLKDFVPPYSASVIENLVAEDAILIGKTNTDEFAMGSTGETSHFGASKNPWDQNCSPGGSSSGSAVAVAMRLCAMALGSDTGGSIRQPAAFCGIVGMKPSYGVVSRYGVIAYASSLDQVGPMGLYAEDCELLLDVMARADAKDSHSYAVARDIPSQSKYRLGIPKQFLSQQLQPAIRRSFDLQIQKLRDQGHEIEETSIESLQYAVACYYLIASSEASSNLARYDGVRFGYRAAGAKNLRDLYRRSRSEAFGAEVKKRIMLGSCALSSGYYDEFFDKACRVRAQIIQDMNLALSRYDFLLAPVSAHFAYPLNSAQAPSLTMYNNDLFTIPANLAGLPAISLPLPRPRDQMPSGLQIMSKAGDDFRLLAFAKEFASSSIDLPEDF